MTTTIARAPSAIEDADFGPQLAVVRILTPAECEAQELVKKLTEFIRRVRGSIDKETLSKLEQAMDDMSVLESLAVSTWDEETRIRMGFWPEGKDFIALREAELLRDYLLRRYHGDLVGYRIEVVAVPKIAPVCRRARLGSAAKLPGKTRYLTGLDGAREVDAVITIGYHEWRRRPNYDRQRLIDHELMHLDVDYETSRLVLVGHDFESFADEVRRYGVRSESGTMAMDGPVAQAIEGAVGSQLELVPAKS